MHNLITILGPTAAGKTSLAAKLAALINGEIISADSRQLYKRMDIGTGKDLSDYVVDGVSIPYHLIDIVEPGVKYNVFEYMRAFAVAFTSVIDKGKIPIFSGGSGMYLDAILSGYELSKVPNDNSLREEMSNLSFDKLIQRLKSYGPLHNISDITSDERLYRAIEIAEFQFKNRVSSLEIPEFNSINFGIMYNLDDVRNRIEKRLIQRIDEGMVDEVKRLIDEGLNPDDLIYYGLEYKFVTNYITGKVNFKQMYNQLNIAIGQFAKKQMTWFRKMEKKGVKIIWIDGQISESEKIAFMLSKLKS
ncbi:MAG: tRNA (adenosine(37)-N6)-dimethylallyltransferase MiaA [Lentimicrobiaceae bacterium]|jgi:tRNA dimethylallyltransferase|nr:tRNA (adenosine(37)-N6)-dimethylallyltransferase MiaA [Lentimicrobiaceae bacterium]MCP4910878.1 tRNA (adenosine(37)-N6)-dimethylallyltransferase MiaA [Bacteroidota bacterium]MBT3453844.1 tRNA (adenosine(37)-N6)-dimethylallyltransferase MiaA [Lentimicrobiaceae bacterium]MBT3819523.1 tRNA (adenosine(37)-N6)-dimethylallyltransferase MiaA [Lentimicrobiaceae bacterium]MBT4061664.1 tRNA (adenosine(37)-N6)-dimethylallyltransferase MiaA [Lentimicrobiaceae bacterium]